MPYVNKKQAQFIVDLIDLYERHLSPYMGGGRLSGVEKVREILEIPAGIPQDTLDAEETGPENSREEVTGQDSHRSTEGFYGGQLMRVAPVRIEMSAIEGS